MDSSHSLVRRLVVGLAASASVVVGIGVGATTFGDSVARAATPNRAAIVVEVDGVIHTAKITFAAESITGLDALRAGGFAPTVRVFGGNGGAVCALRIGTETIGCPADPSCLTCGGADYWAYFRAVAGATRYSYSGVGAGNAQVHDGDVEAWAWSSGTPPSPFVSFADVWGPDPPPPTTTRPPTTSRPPTTPTTARRPPPSTSPSTNGPLGSVTTITASTVPSSSKPSAPGRATVKTSTTVKRRGASTTGAVPTSDAPGDDPHTRKVATAPVVAHGGGGSPYGLIGFAVILALLLAAIVFVHRRRSARAALPI